MRSLKKEIPIQIWLSANIVMVICMVIIGGITRLTDSGLSMTDWRLVMGVFPPMNENEWQIYFNQYKLTPEYLLRNFGMTLEEFKLIFFWEYLHRVWGRVIGIIFFIPLFYFWLSNKISSTDKKFFLILSIIGFFQAFMGWFMVKSGLINKPDVSHFRLSTHLLTAFIIYSMLLYKFWEIYRSNYKISSVILKDEYKIRIYIITSIVLLFLTIGSGAFVAGTDAGLAYNTFPLMDNKILPPILIEDHKINFQSLFYDTGFLQFLHRFLASITVICFSFSCYIGLKSKISKILKNFFLILFIAIIFQYLLGITILLLYVPIYLGLLHQLSSMLILSVSILIFSEIKLNIERNQVGT